MDSFRRVKIINIAPPGERVIIYHENSHLNLSCRWKTDGIFQIAYIESGEIVISTVTIKKGTDIKIVIGKLLSIEEDSFPETFRKLEPDIKCPEIEWNPNGPDRVDGRIQGLSWVIVEIERKVEDSQFWYYVTIFNLKVRYNNIDFAKRYAQDKISEVFRVFNKD